MIRPAQSKDIPAVVGMVAELCRSTRLMVPMDRKVTERTLLHLMTGPRSLLDVAEANGRLVGFIAASVGYGSISAAPVAQEHGWWGEGGSGLRLLLRYEQWAKDQGCEFIRMSTPPTNERAAQVLRKRGFSVSELAWAKAI